MNDKRNKRTAAPLKLSDFLNDSVSKKESYSWNKSTNNLSSNFVSYGSEKEDRLKKEKALSASTLSLHIEAYENSNEANLCIVTKKDLKRKGLIKKVLNAKQMDFDSTLIIQNAFEFARQQENDKALNPEMAQYRASQHLLNPNQMHQSNYQKPLPQHPGGPSDRLTRMDDRFRANLRTPMQSAGRNSLYGRQSLFNQGTHRNSMRPSDVGRFSYGTNVHASAVKKNMAQQMSNAVAVKKLSTRNVRDKSHIEEQRQIIRGFLMDKDSQLDPKYLINPTAGQFQAIFEFIYSHLDPDYHASPSTIRDEFPAIMKNLKYPLPIKTSTMQSISSATSWPYLLDALGYLATFVIKVENLDVMALMDDDGANASRRYHAYDYFTKCFNKQKSDKVSEDGFKTEFEIFRANVMQNENMGEFEDIEKEKIALQEELEELKKECMEEQCAELEENESQLQKDVKAMTSYLDNANDYHKTRLDENERLQKIISGKENTLKNIKDQIAQKREKIKNQPISGQKAREATTQLAEIRERYKSIRAEHKKFEEEPTKLQGSLFKLLSSIRGHMAVIGGKISDIAEDFYSHEEHSRHGFSELGIDRAMDLEAVEERLAHFSKMYNKLLTKIAEDMEYKRRQIQQNKEALEECERTIERMNISTKKYVQDGNAKIKELQRRNDELKFEKNRLDVQANVLNEKQKLADEKLLKVIKELEKLQIQIGDVEVKYGRRKTELEEKYDKLTDLYIDKADNEIERHNQIRKIQKDQDDAIEALLDQHTDLISRISTMTDGDDTTSQ